MEKHEIKEKLIEANKAYRTGNPIMSDEEYDSLKEKLESIDPEDELLKKVGYIDENDDRMELLPGPMYSLEKVKNVEAIYKWFKSKNIPNNSILILTPKYDALSLTVKEKTNKAWTRGNGIKGQRSDKHLSFANGVLNGELGEYISYGEIIIKRDKFLELETEYENTRSFAVGQLNNDEPNEELMQHMNYVRYGVHNPEQYFNTKQELLDTLNKYQPIRVPYILTTIDHLSEEYLKSLYVEWSKDFDIDGLIIELNDLKLYSELGREKNNNPCGARAYKGNFEEIKKTIVIDLTWDTSKYGLIKPVIQIEPIRLDGVTVSNVTGNNAKSILMMGIGPGAEVNVKRSGMVIPFIVSVEKRVTPTLPTTCPICTHLLKWNENNVELICDNIDCEGQKLKRIISFFQILEIDNVSEGILTQLYEAGYNTIEKILKIQKEDLIKLDRFGEKKALNVLKSIESKIKNIPINKLQHASGLFKILGSKKLALIEHFDYKPTFDELMAIDGFSDKSATCYLNGYDKFQEFIKELPISIAKKERKEFKSTSLMDQTFVFTGIRRKDLEEIIVNNGGKISDSVSKNTTYLVMKSKGSGSSKETKAINLGITILTVEELEEKLNGL